MAALRLPVFVEPFISAAASTAYATTSARAAATRAIAIASGLAGTSAYTWLKLPVTDDPDDMAAVLRPPPSPPSSWAATSARTRTERTSGGARPSDSPTVQGLVAGRSSALLPARGSVEDAVDTAVGLL